MKRSGISYCYNYPLILQMHLLNITGLELRNQMILLTQDSWDKGDRYVFNCRQTSCLWVFTIYPNPTEDQPVNGDIGFCDEQNQLRFPSYQDLQHVFVRGFASRYKQYLTETFNTNSINPLDPYFQAFVLLQFEIARRVLGDHRNIPNRFATTEAIEKALQYDAQYVYQVLLEMLTNSNYEQRRSFRNQLLSM